jgi:hypothetical protein
MNFQFLGMVPITLGAAIFVDVRRRQWAETFYRYYNSIPDPNWRPHGFRGSLGRYAARQNVMSWMAIVVCLAFATIFGVSAFILN